MKYKNINVIFVFFIAFFFFVFSMVIYAGGDGDSEGSGGSVDSETGKVTGLSSVPGDWGENPPGGLPDRLSDPGPPTGGEGGDGGGSGGGGGGTGGGPSILCAQPQCIVSSWSPDPSTVCAGESFTQTAEITKETGCCYSPSGSYCYNTPNISGSISFGHTGESCRLECGHLGYKSWGMWSWDGRSESTCWCGNGAVTPYHCTYRADKCIEPSCPIQTRTAIGTKACLPTVSLNTWPTFTIPDPVSLYWGSTNANSCIASGDWSGNKAVQGEERLSKPRGNYTFTLTCTGLGGSAFDTENVSVIQVPQCSFTANPGSIILPASSTLSWSCQYTDSCSIDQNIGSINPVSGTKSVRPTSTTTYTLTCSGLDGSRSSQVIVNVGFEPTRREVIPR